MLLIAGVSSMQSVEKKAAIVDAAAHAGAEPDTDDARATGAAATATDPPKFGPDQTVQLHVTEVGDPATRQLLEQKLAVVRCHAAVIDSEAGRPNALGLAGAAVARRLRSTSHRKSWRRSPRCNRFCKAHMPPLGPGAQVRGESSGGRVDSAQVTAAVEAPAEGEERPAQIPARPSGSSNPIRWPRPLSSTPRRNRCRSSAQRVISPSTPSVFVAAGGGGVGVAGSCNCTTCKRSEQGKR